MDPSEEGGDPACWAHLFEEESDDGEDPEEGPETRPENRHE